MQTANKNTSSNNLPGKRYDDLYYLENTFFQVQNRLFQVPQFSVAKSKRYFIELFDIDVEGITSTSDNDPIQIRHASADDFRRVLKVVFPLYRATTKDLIDGWTAILKLSIEKEHPEHRQYAIDKLEPLLDLEIVDKILFARQYHVKEWLLRAYEALVSRKSTISEPEMERLGMISTNRILRIRERRSQGSWKIMLRSTLEKEFRSELEDVEKAYCSDATEGAVIGEVARDETYYLESVVIKVEDRLFKIPRQFFEKGSTIFRCMFTLPQGTEVTEGSSDDYPLSIDGKWADFRGLLSILHPMDDQKVEFNQDRWLSILNFSTMWEFLEARKQAIKAIDLGESSYVEQLVLAKRFNVSAWLRNAYRKIVQDVKMLTVREMKQIGLENALAISLLQREWALDPRAYVWEEKVEEIFGDEAKEMDMMYSVDDE